MRVDGEFKCPGLLLRHKVVAVGIKVVKAETAIAAGCGTVDPVHYKLYSGQRLPVGINQPAAQGGGPVEPGAGRCLLLWVNVDGVYGYPVTLCPHHVTVAAGEKINCGLAIGAGCAAGQKLPLFPFLNNIHQRFCNRFVGLGSQYADLHRPWNRLNLF